MDARCWLCPELLAGAGEGGRDNTYQTFPSQQRWEETALPEAHGEAKGRLWEEGTRSSLAAGQARSSREPRRQESLPACACAKGGSADCASPSHGPP